MDRMKPNDNAVWHVSAFIHPSHDKWKEMYIYSHGSDIKSSREQDSVGKEE